MKRIFVVTLLITVFNVKTMSAWAASNIKGVIETVKAQEIELSSKDTYSASDKTVVTSSAGREIDWMDLNPGDYVNIELNPAQKILSIKLLSGHESESFKSSQELHALSLSLAVLLFGGALVAMSLLKLSRAPNADSRQHFYHLSGLLFIVALTIVLMLNYDEESKAVIPAVLGLMGTSLGARPKRPLSQISVKNNRRVATRSDRMRPLRSFSQAKFLDAFAIFSFRPRF